MNLQHIDACSTNSIYFKLDFGLSCGIRIVDYLGKKKYYYRFNVIKDYNGDRVTLFGNLISYFYSFNEFNKVIDAVKQERENKINKYGIQKYREYMKQQAKSELYNRFRSSKLFIFKR